MYDIVFLGLGLAVGLCVGICSMLVWYQSAKQKLIQSLSEERAAHLAAKEWQSQSERELGKSRIYHQQQQEEIIRLNGEVKRLTAEKTFLDEKLHIHKQELVELHNTSQLTFEHLAHEALNHNAKQLNEHHESTLRALFYPLQSRLNEFEQKVFEIYDKEARERLLLQREIQQLAQLNQQMSEDAQNLTKALKGENKVQGDWGEMILKRLLEGCGLKEGREFTTQAQFLGQEKEVLRPDVIIYLPEKRHLVIDSKVSLVAYEKWLSAEEVEKEAHLKALVQSILAHVKGLGRKAYDRIPQLNSPDFVLLFMPIEPAFNLAIQYQPNLFSIAWQYKVALVSPGSLLATLKTVSSIWRLERQNQHAQEIARQGGLLYDKLVGFVDEVEKIGKEIQHAQQSFDSAMRKLRDGRGSLITRAERLKELGVETRKEIRRHSS